MLRPNKSYFYKIEAITASGAKQVFGPLQVRTKKLFAFGG